MSLFGTVKEKVGEAAEQFRKKITLSLTPKEKPVDESRREALEKQIEYAASMRGMTQHLGWQLYVKEQEDALNTANKALQDPASTRTMEEVRYLQAEVRVMCRELTRVDTAIHRARDASEELKKMTEVPAVGDGPLDLPFEGGDEEDVA